MTIDEKTALFEAVRTKLNTTHHRECFIDDNFAEFDVPCNTADEFTQWFLDNNMGGSLMAHLNSEYNCDLTLTFNINF